MGDSRVIAKFATSIGKDRLVTSAPSTANGMTTNVSTRLAVRSRVKATTNGHSR